MQTINLIAEKSGELISLRRYATQVRKNARLLVATAAEGLKGKEGEDEEKFRECLDEIARGQEAAARLYEAARVAVVDRKAFA